MVPYEDVTQLDISFPRDWILKGSLEFSNPQLVECFIKL